MSEALKLAYTEEEWMKILDEKVAAINEFIHIPEMEFANDWAYLGVRLVLKVVATGAEVDLSRRYFYDEPGQPDYDDYYELVETVVKIARRIKEDS
jgi:hypothetical protein